MKGQRGEIPNWIVSRKDKKLDWQLQNYRSKNKVQRKKRQHLRNDQHIHCLLQISKENMKLKKILKRRKRKGKENGSSF
ncbi:hypothetical protein SNE40_018178 [Patella caerulea]|uniref:Uncharacterized protein n=1 Tax=Patella caerulea TaxID=87958 RepID=A0AAN8J9N5_PATCE